MPIRYEATHVGYDREGSLSFQSLTIYCPDSSLSLLRPIRRSWTHFIILNSPPTLIEMPKPRANDMTFLSMANPMDNEPQGEGHYQTEDNPGGL